MPTDNFYIHLDSQVTRTSPLMVGNTIGNFITRLNRRFNLSDEWEVALSKIHYTHSWYNIPKDQKLYLVNKDKNGTKNMIELNEIFPAGYYTNIEKILIYLNEIYSEHCKIDEQIQEPPFFEYNNNSNLIRIRLGLLKNGQDLEKLLYPQMII